jgi:hypothetical protein
VTSVALQEWRGASSRSLDEVESLHQLVHDMWGGELDLAQQIVYAYATLILAHFQRYCRAVHTETAGILADAVADPGLGDILMSLLVRDRFLSRGNPTPASLGGDFARFGFKLWPELEAVDQVNLRRRDELGQLCDWRNGITHGDIDLKRAAERLIPRELDMETCQKWRRSLGDLAVWIDELTARRCRELGCGKPW